MLSVKDTALLLIDIQEKLIRVMHEKEQLIDNLQKLIQGIKVLDIPILWMEQNPKGLGPTISEVARLLSDTHPLEKKYFSCCGQAEFVQQLKNLQCKHILTAGIETHVCVYQTAMDLFHLGYEVQIVTDAVSSRTPDNKLIGLERLKQGGMVLTSTEMVLFELLRVAEGPEFKAILNIVK